MTRRTSFTLSGAQLGITVTGLLVGYVAEPLIGESPGALLGGVGVPTGVGIGIGAVLALLFATVVQMLSGELFPRNLAIARPGPVALWLARSTVLYLRALGWLIWVFDQASNLLLRAEHRARARRHRQRPRAHRREVPRERDLPVELSMMLDRILDFPRRDVELALIPRSRVAGLLATDDLGTAWPAWPRATPATRSCPSGGPTSMGRPGPTPARAGPRTSSASSSWWTC